MDLFILLLISIILSIYVCLAIFYFFFIIKTYNKRVVNFTLLNTKDIKTALSYLPKKYLSNTLPVFIFPNRFVYNLYVFLLPNSICRRNDISKNTTAFFLHNDDTSLCVVIFYENYYFNFLHSLYHEFRHVYQFQNNYFKKSFGNDTLSINYDNKTILKYNLQEEERDANLFAAYFIKKNIKKLSKRFDFSYKNFFVNLRYLHCFKIEEYNEKSFYILVRKLKMKIFKYKTLLKYNLKYYKIIK